MTYAIRDLESQPDPTLGLRRGLSVATLLLVVAALLSLAVGDFGARDPEQRLAAARDAAAEAGGVRFEGRMAMTGGGVDVEIEMTGEFDIARQTGRFDFDAPGQDPLVAFFDGSRVFVVLPQSGAAAAGVKCVTAVIEEPAGVDQRFTQNPLEALDRLGAIRGEAEEVGREEVRGVDTTHFRTQYDGTKGLQDRERRVLENNPEMLQNLTNLPLEVWLDEHDRPVRMLITMDFGGGAGLAPGAEMTATFEWFDYGSQVDVQVPTGCREVPRDDLANYAR